MNQQLKQEIHAVLQRNAGNQLTEDLIMGISVRLLTIVEKAFVDAGQEIQSLQAQLSERQDSEEETDG